MGVVEPPSLLARAAVFTVKSLVWGGVLYGAYKMFRGLCLSSFFMKASLKSVHSTYIQQKMMFIFRTNKRNHVY